MYRILLANVFRLELYDCLFIGSLVRWLVGSFVFRFIRNTSPRMNEHGSGMISNSMKNDQKRSPGGAWGHFWRTCGRFGRLRGARSLPEGPRQEDGLVKSSHFGRRCVIFGPFGVPPWATKASQIRTFGNKFVQNRENVDPGRVPEKT